MVPCPRTLLSNLAASVEYLAFYPIRLSPFPLFDLLHTLQDRLLNYWF